MASKVQDGEMEDEPRGLISLIKSIITKPFRIALSKPARRAYLTTVLAFLTAFSLFGVAVTAYVLFYYSYIPRIGFERAVHLQFDDVYRSASGSVSGGRGSGNPYPYGTVGLAPDVVSQQGYDVKIELQLPRSPANREAGNFMIDVQLLGAVGEKKNAGGVLEKVIDGIAPGVADDGGVVLARSRRPAMLRYRSWIVEAAWRLTELHWYILGFRHEDETLEVQVFEQVEFAKGWRNVPASLRLEIQSERRMQIYSAKALFRARFTGLRWLVYNHRIISAVIFVGGFWTTEMVFAGLAWAAIAAMLSSPHENTKDEDDDYDRIKSEQDYEDEKKPILSDTERTFPTTSRQQPLRYLSPDVKQEDSGPSIPLQDVAPVGGEADDEDEDADFFLDSGIGSSGGRPGGVKKRRGRVGSRDGGG